MVKRSGHFLSDPDEGKPVADGSPSSGTSCPFVVRVPGSGQKQVMALLAIAFCWAHKTGEWKHQANKNEKTWTEGAKFVSLRAGLSDR